MKAIKVEKLSGAIVKVIFDDEVEVTFYPYSHGFGYAVEGMERLIIRKNGKELFNYSGRLYRCGPQPEEHQIKFIDDETKLIDYLLYWSEAKDYCFYMFYGYRPPVQYEKLDEETNDKYWYPWKLSMEGSMSLHNLAEKHGVDLKNAKSKQ